jgi:hypothetical protein
MYFNHLKIDIHVIYITNSNIENHQQHYDDVTERATLLFLHNRTVILYWSTYYTFSGVCPSADGGTKDEPSSFISDYSRGPGTNNTTFAS